MLIIGIWKYIAVSVFRQLFLQWCGVLIIFFAVLQYPEPPSAPLHTVPVQFGSVQVLFLFTLYWYSLNLCKFCSCSHCAGTVWICASFVPVHTVLVQFGSVQVLFLFTLYQYSLDLCKFCSRLHCTGTVSPKSALCSLLWRFSFQPFPQ